MAIYDVTDLKVYNKALSSLKLIYKLAYQIPDSHYKLRNQIISSAESIPPLIAEGFAKRSSAKEFKRFLKIAMGSSDETITHGREIFILSETTKRIDKNLCNQIIKEYKIISKQLNSLIKNWVDHNTGYSE
jgi:four helix bundle protein